VKLKKLIGIAGLAAFLVSWAAVAAGALMQVDRNTWVVLVVIAAFATEALFWCVAFMLGLGIVEARSTIVRWLKNWLRGKQRVDVTER
jgi:hypothetical protein